jgi:uncharacterized protein
MIDHGSVKAILDRLRVHRPEVLEKFGIDILGLGGSVARGEHRSDSDIDISARIIKRIGFFEIVDATQMLELVLDCKVDLVFSDALPEYRRASFERDVISLS